jgi:murein L,D-transpeptidase YcbB/YkuD
MSTTTPQTAGDHVEAGLGLRLNVPAYRLDVVEGETRTHAFRVAVGTPDHPTPLGDFWVRQIVWNPWWVPPPFEWAETERVTPPGPNNPTGRVKFMFGQYLFIHGTPAESTLGRAASHGCVRMANDDAIALARLLQVAGMPGVASREIDSLVANPHATRAYALERPIPLSIEYRLAELQGEQLELHPDVYGKGGLTAEGIGSLLEEKGGDRRIFDPVLLDALLARAEDEHVSVRVEDLLAIPSGRDTLSARPLLRESLSRDP